jgi:hypothetical protein
VSQFDDDLDTMLADFDPVSVVFGTYSGQGLRDLWDEEVSHGTEAGVVYERQALILKTSAFPGLLTGSLLLCDGEPYVVTGRGRPADSADGRLTLVYLKRKG